MNSFDAWLPRSRGIDRRRLLEVGYSGLLGISLPAVLGHRAEASEAAGRRVRPAKSVILVLLSGGPSHLDTLDPKPDAPDGIRGEFDSIASNVPGVRICEHLPLLAARLDRVAIIRSLAHRESSHLPATHKLLTGSPMPGRRGTDLDNVLSRRDWPCYAAGLDYVRPRQDGLPTGVTLPNHLVEGPLTWPGQHAGFLGPKHDPWQIEQDPNDAGFREQSLSLPPGLGLDRLDRRRALLEQFNRQRERLAALAEGQEFAGQQQLAISLLTSGRVAQAFEIGREPDEVRERYGRHLFGQSLLLARRLVQAGVPVVQANMGIVQTWDTHVANFSKLKERLLPPLDRAVAVLLDDLAALGMWDETLVVLAGEFGRTPRISTLPGESAPGRDHWPGVYSAAFAGAGVQGGQVIGSSDKIGAYPLSRPYTPDDLGATVYHVLGVDPAVEIHDRLGRPLRLNGGEVIVPLFSGAAG